MSLATNEYMPPSPPAQSKIRMLGISSGGVVVDWQDSVEAVIRHMESAYKNPVKVIDLGNDERLLIVNAGSYDANFSVAGNEYVGYGYVVGFRDQNYCDSKMDSHQVQLIFRRHM